jgi:hypothetical protein
MSNPELAFGALAKPAKGTATLERRGKRAEIRTHEQTEKAKVVKRDGAKVCRLVPNCPEKEKFETAHLNDKGMGGDHGNRSTADQMIRACFFHHQGKWSLHSGDIRVDCLTDRGTDGPVEVYGRGIVDGRWYLVKRETSAGHGVGH